MASAAQAAREIPEKSLFRIGEVSRLTETKTFVLRFWESEFPALQPVKSPSGHRLYRREDIETVFEIKRLLYEEGFTIAGARKHLAEKRGIAAENGADGAGVAASVAGGAPVGSADASTAVPAAGEPLTAGASTEGVVRVQAPARLDPTTRMNRRLLEELREELLAALTLLKAE